MSGFPDAVAPPLRLAVLTDLHLGRPGAPGRRWISAQRVGDSGRLLRSALSSLAGSGADAMAILGDIADGADPGEIERLVDLAGTLDMPVFIVPGNHDLDRSPAAIDDAIARRPGSVVRHAEPAGVPLAGLTVAGSRIALTGRGWDCRVTALPAFPAAAGPVIWLAHHPVLSMSGELTAAGLPYAGDAVNRASVAGVLAAHPWPVLALTGHLHVRAHAISGNILQLAQAALVEQPHDLSLIDIWWDAQAGRMTVARSCQPACPPGFRLAESESRAALDAAELTWDWSTAWRRRAGIRSA